MKLQIYIIAGLIGFLGTWIPVNAQIIASGLIIDSTTLEPIDFANVFLAKNPNIGTFSNEKGEFRLTINENLWLEGLDTLIVSALEYQTKSVPLDTLGFTNNLKILVHKNEINLSTIEIIAPNTDLIEKVVQKLHKQNSNKVSTLKGTYREITYRNNNPVFFCEALVTISDPGFKKDFSSGKIYIEAIRKTDDLRKLDSTQLFVENHMTLNGLYTLLDKNFIRNHNIDQPSETNPFLNSNILSSFDFEYQGSILKDQDVFFEYSIKPKRANMNFESSTSILIDQKRQSIISMDVGRRLNQDRRRAGYFSEELLNKELPNGYFSEYTKIRYELEENKYFLNYISNVMVLNDLVHDNSNKLIVFRELVINQVINEKKNVPIDAIEVDINNAMKDQKISNESVNWDSFNFRINSDLELLTNQKHE